MEKAAMPCEVTLELRFTSGRSLAWEALWQLLLAPPRGHPPGPPKNETLEPPDQPQAQ